MSTVNQIIVNPYNFLVHISLKAREKRESKKEKHKSEETKPEKVKPEKTKKLTKKEIIIIDKRLRQSYPQMRSFDEEAENEGRARRKLRKFQSRKPQPKVK